ncbi:lytic polysaccharide monooxygenase [Paenibacillus kribbensis]|uniref:Chitin-binding protein n=1 Tax=Paenibacillus kribbensis TaxID=172713 RepID=A0A222WJ75_9BACL|nr:lytic polysaccharide monooxygenase [Paenibacillus kribbensis]ASR46062.1 chitin-binding protein [Paenibacillus kribbensis]
MTNQTFVNHRKLSMKWFIFSIGALFLMLAGSFVFAESASAHGYLTDSRAHLCSTGQNTNCGPVRWEPFSVEGRGDFPEFGVPDGKIASGAKFLELDEQTADRWTKVDMVGGEHTFHWKLTANHSTNTWDYFITKKDWDPNSPLKREDLELFCRYIDDGAIPPIDTYNDCFVPNDREGYHVIVGVWDIADTENAFYQAMDVKLSINPSAPTTPDKGFPGDPNRFGKYLVWNTIRVYTEGEIVLHNGQLWQALWWTRGQEPGTTGQWGPWKLIGDVPPDEEGSTELGSA